MQHPHLTTLAREVEETEAHNRALAARIKAEQRAEDPDLRRARHEHMMACADPGSRPMAESEARMRRARVHVRTATAAVHRRAASSRHTMPRPRGAGRPAARRTGSSSRTSSADPGDSDPAEPPPPLWRHPRFGACSPNLLRVLIQAEARS